jgi:hypothetical protein
MIGRSDRYEMVPPPACANGALVVDVVALRDLPNEQLVRHPVNAAGPLPYPDHPIAASILRARP